MPKYRFTYSGGRGPDFWDAEMTVEAETIRAALDIAEPKIKEAGAEIDAIDRHDS